MDWRRLLPNRRHAPGWWWRRVARWAGEPATTPGSVVIPCSGTGYVEEAALSARFASEHSGAEEVLVVTDQPGGSFGPLPPRVEVRTLTMVDGETPREHPFASIWKSRWIKMAAPLEASRPVVLMIDSDLLLLKEARISAMEGVIQGTMFRGKIGHRMKKHQGAVPELRRSPRLWVKWHVNGGFLAARRATWERLCPRWRFHYRALWTRLPDEMPVDQIPLVMAMDELRIATADLGVDYNWSVPKRIGGRPAIIPESVIGAHGGFPLSEWEKYRADRQAVLNFRGEDYTRKARYPKREG